VRAGINHIASEIVYNVTTEAADRPKVGDVVFGLEIKDSERKGDLNFILTGARRMVRVKHVVESRFAPNGMFYVIGTVAQLLRKN
jgi:hypothetical protein